MSAPYSWAAADASTRARESWSAQEVWRGPQVLPERMPTISSTEWPATSLLTALRLPLQPPSKETCSMVLPSSDRSMWMAREQTPRGV